MHKMFTDERILTAGIEHIYPSEQFLLVFIQPACDVIVTEFDKDPLPTHLIGRIPVRVRLFHGDKPLIGRLGYGMYA